MKIRRELGLITSKFNDAVELKEVDEFIKHWLGYAVTIISGKRKKIFDRQIVLSSALEACYEAFIQIKKKNIEITEKAAKGFLRLSCKQCYYQQLVEFSVIPDRKRIYFPKGWVKFEDYFKYSEIYDKGHEAFDLAELIKAGKFTETEVYVINFLVKGWDAVEIAKVSG